MHPNGSYTIIKKQQINIINPEQTRRIIKHKACLKRKPRFTDKVYTCAETCVTCKIPTFQSLSERLRLRAIAYPKA